MSMYRSYDFQRIVGRMKIEFRSGCNVQDLFEFILTVSWDMVLSYFRRDLLMLVVTGV